MANEILMEKSAAGNPHVRFDEGEVTSAKLRRGSLLYNTVRFALVLAAAPVEAVAAGSPDDPDVVVTEGETVITSGTRGDVYYGVYDPGRIKFAIPQTELGYFTVGGVVGDGVIAFDSPGMEMTWCGGSATAPVVFGGTMVDEAPVTIRDGAFVNWTNDATAASLTWRIQGSLGVSSVGRRDMPSALGTRTTIWLGTLGGYGALRYLGPGETTDKDFRFNSSATLDGGERGGLVLQGDLYTKCPLVLTLDGANTNAEAACVIDGTVTHEPTNAIYFVKRGNGTWRFTAKSRAMTGVVAVERGVLEYASMAEKGTKCSLGDSTCLLEQYEGAYDQERLVPWSYLLGDGSAIDTFDALPDALPTFRYVGADAVSCTSRLVAVKGAARIVNGGESPFSWKGAVAVGSGESKLVLDGTGSSDAFAGLSDGADGGTLGVVKTGSGTWRLKGDLDFTGGLDVRGGMLTIGCDTYRRYRFIVKELYNDVQAQVQRFVMLDAAGNNVTAGISYREDIDNQAELLSAGESCYLYKLQSGLEIAYQIDRFFEPASMWQGASPKSKSNASANFVHLTTPGNWIKFEFRLPQGVDTPVRWDFASRNGNGSAVYNRNPTCYELQGSFDGLAWDTLTEVVSNHTVKTSAMWFSNNTPTNTADHGYVINTGTNGVRFLESVAYVSVSGGATLAAEYPVKTAELRVDAAAGGGTIRGMSLQPGGLLSLASSPGTGLVTLPVRLEDCIGIENLPGWRVEIDGRTTTRKVAVDASGNLMVESAGFMLIIR